LSYAGEKDTRSLPHTQATDKSPILFADARISGERFGRFQVLNHGAEIDRLGIKGLVLCDFRSI